MYWPSVPLCDALQLYRNTLFTGSTGSAPDAPVRVSQIIIKINTPHKSVQWGLRKVCLILEVGVTAVSLQEA